MDLGFLDDMLALRLPYTRGRQLLAECAALAQHGALRSPHAELTPSRFAAILGVSPPAVTLGAKVPRSTALSDERAQFRRALARVLESPAVATGSSDPDLALLIGAANEFLSAFTMTNDLRYLDWAAKVALVAIGRVSAGRPRAGEASALCMLLDQSLQLLDEHRAPIPEEPLQSEVEGREWFPKNRGPGVAQRRPFVVIVGPGSGTGRQLAAALRAVQLRPAAVFSDSSGYPSKCYPVGKGGWYPPGAVPAPVRTDAHPSGHCGESPVLGRSAPSVPLDDELLSASLAKSGARLAVLAGCGRVSSSVLQLFPDGVINAHNGSLPHARGMDAVAWSRLKGISPGATLHYASSRVDAGGVIAHISMGQQASKAEFKEVMVGLLVDAIAHYCAGNDLQARAVAHEAGVLHFPMNPLFRAMLTAEVAAAGGLRGP